MNKIKRNYRTDYLFPKEDFITGFGSIFNIVGNYYTYNYSKNPDNKAIESDWGVVGQDIEIAIAQEKRVHKTKQPIR